jgi:DNA-binding response OmpR family regulator
MNVDLTSPEPRALIVEDEILIAEELRERLARLGFSVIAAVDNAEEAVAIAVRERPELVLMDIRLKGEKDGVQAAREIRKQVDVPLVYLTAYSDRLTVDRVSETEHDGYILKPFQSRELQSTLRWRGSATPSGQRTRSNLEAARRGALLWVSNSRLNRPPGGWLRLSPFLFLALPSSYCFEGRPSSSRGQALEPQPFQ